MRRDLVLLDRPAAMAPSRADLGLPLDRFVVAVFGGSLGSKVLNDAVVGMVDLLADRGDVAVRHVVGDRWLADAPPARTDPAGIMYRVIGYEDRMPQLYAASDLMVTRAGASTIAELAVTGTPAILVPWPGAAENHQVDNARTLSDVGAAVLLEEHALTGERLLAEIDRLAHDADALATIAGAASTVGDVHRSDALIELIEEVAAR